MTEASETNRQWRLKRRPQGKLSVEDFDYREVQKPDPAGLKSDELLLQNVVFLCAPTMRNWMEPPGNGLYPSTALDAPVMALAAARVVASTDPKYPPGTRVFAMSSWQDYQVMPTNAGLPLSPIAEGLSFIDGLGRYGLNPLTAYFGLLDVGQPKAGETLVVSGAAGSTGSAAAQIGKIQGLHVVGIAGGKAKCDWLTTECGIDAAIDYKSEDVAARLADLCPQGINVFFDNVGGDILQAAVNNMAPFGRVVLCGQISSYNDDAPAEGPRNMMRLVYGSIRMQGFLCGSYSDRFGEGVANLKAWTEKGQLIHREDVRSGFEDLPQHFGALFDGSNNGTLLVTIDQSASHAA